MLPWCPLVQSIEAEAEKAGNEVRTSSVSDTYWEHVRQRSMQFERGWIESVKHPSKAIADVAKKSTIDLQGQQQSFSH
jgi:hypothetical protein